MKTTLTLIICAALYSCSTEKELQADIIDVQLIKIDTVARYPNSLQKLLTWRSVQNVDYVTYEPITSEFTLGSRMKVMITK